MVIWDLFGGSQNSVYHALKYFKNVKIYTFDIAEIQHENQHYLDLSSDNVLNFLSNFEKPDMIFASPLCQSFSWILNCCDGERVGWTKRNGIWLIRDVNEIEFVCQSNNFLKQNNPVKMHKRAVLGKKCLENTIRIIKFFQPKFWYIENPQLSLMWEVLRTNYNFSGYYNLAHYNSYDLSFSLKPTIFLSNHKLELKAYNIKNNIDKKRKSTQRVLGSYADNEQGERVKIPHLLIIDIYDQLKKLL